MKYEIHYIYTYNTELEKIRIPTGLNLDTVIFTAVDKTECEQYV